MLPLLKETLTEHKAASERAGPDDPIFVTPTASGARDTNIRQDIVDAGVAMRTS